MNIKNIKKLCFSLFLIIFVQQNSYAISQHAIEKIKNEVILEIFDHEPFASTGFMLATLSGMCGGGVRIPTKHLCPRYVRQVPKNYAPEITKTVYYFHGWGEPMPEKNLGLNAYEHTEVFTVYFSEYRENIRFKTNFGQKQDVKEALECLKETYDEKRTSITLVGRSRGGHVLILLLLALVYNVENILDEVGIDKNMQEKLIKQIRAGNVIIVVPLLNMQKTLLYTFGQKIGTWWHKKFGPHLTEKLYNPDGWHADTCLEMCNKKNDIEKPQFNITFIYALYDNILKNVKDVKPFLEQLSYFNGKDIKIIEAKGSHFGRAQQEKLEIELNTLFTS